MKTMICRATRLAGNARFVVGRLGGTLQFFDAKTGQPGKVAASTR